MCKPMKLDIKLADKMPFKREYRTSEVAKIFGLTRESVMNRIRSGELPAKKFGCQYRIQEEDLIEYLAKYD